jgi:hypothetical protein
MLPPYSAKAVAFGKTLSNTFASKVGLPTTCPNEIKKFTALIDSFSATSGTQFHVESYHGTRYQVRFSSILPWTRLSPRCELCDVMFIIFTASEIRVSFLQAKATCLSHPLPIQVANAEQYAILALRPIITHWITPWPKFSTSSASGPWPNDILSSAILPSAGSFGTFFDRVVGTKTVVDFHYVVADVLGAKSTPVPSKKFVSCSLDIFLPVQTARTYDNFLEIVQCDGMANFGTALYAMQIGTPIHPAVDASPGMSQDIKDALQATRLKLALWIDSQTAPSNVLRSLRRLLDVQTNFSPSLATPILGARQVVVVQADSFTSN